jgi:hypothetical protein
MANFKDKVKLKLDLNKIFSNTFATRSPDFRNQIRPFLNDLEFKRAYGEAVIDRIRKRTINRKIDKNNKPFKPYSTAYAKTLKAQVYGKKAGQVANLRLTGEMLTSMKHTSKSRRTEIVIDFIDEKNAAKAHGHIHGVKPKPSKKKRAKGKPAPKGMPKRDFFGLPKKELNKIMMDTVRSFNLQTLASQIGTEELASLLLLESEATVEGGLAIEGGTL